MRGAIILSTGSSQHERCSVPAPVGCFQLHETVLLSSARRAERQHRVMVEAWTLESGAPGFESWFSPYGSNLLSRLLVSSERSFLV